MQLQLVVASVSSSILAALGLFAFQWATSEPRSVVSAGAAPIYQVPRDSRTTPFESNVPFATSQFDPGPPVASASGSSSLKPAVSSEPTVAVPRTAQSLPHTDSSVPSPPATARNPQTPTADNSAQAATSDIAIAQNDVPRVVNAEVPSDASPASARTPVHEPVPLPDGSAQVQSPTQPLRQLSKDSFPNAPVAWNDIPDTVSFGIPGSSSDGMKLRFAGYRPNVFTFKRSLFDISKGEEIARLPAEFETEGAVVSPDAANVIRIRIVSHKKVLFYLHPVSQLDKPEKLDVPDVEELHFAEFLTNHLLLIGGEKNSVVRLDVFDINSRTRIATYPLKGHIRDPSFSVSPSGSQLAVKSGDEELSVLSLIDGSVICSLDRPRSAADRSYVQVNSLRFSADGNEIVGTIFPGQIVVWTASDGNLTLQETVPDVVYELIGEEGRAIDWLPDGSGWLVGGRKIVDRKTLAVVWEADSESHRFRGFTSCVLSLDQILAPIGDNETLRLVPVRIPWNEIRSKLAKCKPTEAASLLPGSDVSLELNIQQLRVNDDASVRAELTSSAEKVTSAAGLSISPNAKTRMVIHYSETASKDRLRDGMLSRLLIGEDPDDAEINTDVVATIELQNAASGEVYWSRKLNSTGWLSEDGERNEQSLRAAAFAAIREKIEGMELPTFLCPGVYGQFPVVSKLP